MSAQRPLPKGLFLGLGGGVLLISIVVILRILGAASTGREGRVGDGADPATYGFALETTAIEAETIVASSRPRDGLPALDLPKLMNAAAVDSLNEAERGKYLVTTDLVVGVVIGGEARAWPLRVLDWHPAINDTLGGRPLLVSTCPLTGSPRVYDPHLDGEARLFGISGLIGRSNTLLYARDDTLSLWTQIDGRAITGPAAAAGRILQEVPSVVCPWSEWRRRYPGTTVPYPAKEYRKRYKSDPYFAYRHGEKLRFPVVGDVPKRPFEPQLIVRIAGEQAVLDVRRIAAAAGEGGVWTLELDGATLPVHVGTSNGVETPPIWIAGAEARDDLRCRPLYAFAREVFDLGGGEVLP